MKAERHRFTFRQTRRTVPITFSIMSVRRVSAATPSGNPSRVTKNLPDAFQDRAGDPTSLVRDVGRGCGSAFRPCRRRPAPMLVATRAAPRDYALMAGPQKACSLPARHLAVLHNAHAPPLCGCPRHPPRKQEWITTEVGLGRSRSQNTADAMRAADLSLNLIEHGAARMIRHRTIRNFIPKIPGLLCQ